MERLITLVRTYRFTTALDMRLQLAEEILTLVEPDMRIFLLGKGLSLHDTEDVLQNVLIGIFRSLGNFQGSTQPEFWKWCYQIARHKIFDEFGRQAADRVQHMPPEDLRQLVDASAQENPIPAGERDELEYAMKLLTASKPECFDYLWQHYVIGLAYAEIATERGQSYDGVRMKVSRCLEEAQSLMF